MVRPRRAEFIREEPRHRRNVQEFPALRRLQLLAVSIVAANGDSAGRIYEDSMTTNSFDRQRLPANLSQLPQCLGVIGLIGEASFCSGICENSRQTLWRVGILTNSATTNAASSGPYHASGGTPAPQITKLVVRPRSFDGLNLVFEMPG